MSAIQLFVLSALAVSGVNAQAQSVQSVTVVECQGPKIPNSDGHGDVDIKYEFVIRLDEIGAEANFFGATATWYRNQKTVEELKTFLNDPAQEILSISELSKPLSTNQSEPQLDKLYIDRQSQTLESNMAYDAGFGSGGILFRVLEIRGTQGYLYDNHNEWEIPEAKFFGRILPLHGCVWKL